MTWQLLKEVVSLYEWRGNKVPAVKICKRDLEISSDTTFSVTADAPMARINSGSIDRVNTDMMNVKWRFFHFWEVIPESSQVRMTPCPRFFAAFILQNANNLRPFMNLFFVYTNTYNTVVWFPAFSLLLRHLQFT